MYSTTDKTGPKETINRNSGAANNNAAADHYGVDANAAAEEAHSTFQDRVYGSMEGSHQTSLRRGEEYSNMCGMTNKKHVYLLAGTLMFVGVIGVALGGYYLASTSSSSHHDDHTHCDSPYGAFCGCTGMVPAYSNCNSYYTSMQDNFINVTVDEAVLKHHGIFWPQDKLVVGAEGSFSSSSSTAAGPLPPKTMAANGNPLKATVEIYTGMRYQCVEYSRRFIASSSQLNKYATFGSVDGASDIFAIANVTSIFDDTMVYDFETYTNYDTANSMPAFGDLVIYPIQGTTNDFPYGHVAVVAYVDEARGVVGVAEQNWDNKLWPVSSQCGKASADKPDYAREIKLVYEAATKSYAMVDQQYIIRGWKRVGKRLV